MSVKVLACTCICVHVFSVDWLWGIIMGLGLSRLPRGDDNHSGCPLISTGIGASIKLETLGDEREHRCERVHVCDVFCGSGVTCCAHVFVWISCQRENERERQKVFFFSSPSRWVNLCFMEIKYGLHPPPCLQMVPVERGWLYLAHLRQGTWECWCWVGSAVPRQASCPQEPEYDPLYLPPVSAPPPPSFLLLLNLPCLLPGIDFLPPDKAWPGLLEYLDRWVYWGRCQVHVCMWGREGERGRKRGGFVMLNNLWGSNRHIMLVGDLAGHSVPKSSFVTLWINNHGSPALLIKSFSFWFSIFSPSFLPPPHLSFSIFLYTPAN